MWVSKGGPCSWEPPPPVHSPQSSGSSKCQPKRHVPLSLRQARAPHRARPDSACAGQDSELPALPPPAGLPSSLSRHTRGSLHNSLPRAASHLRLPCLVC
ncbi:hypothetical protein KIL84_013043 [Mauremys mutica]|uniref:Uncharacterized protein n=1 Tax=Mauremys mutica TaxID=74926 RepID=A0A9D3XSN2_9SAUR|nr:hypothetical protein KIL84_013043 [Mauremys mutica]